MTQKFSPKARRTLLLGTGAATIMIAAATGANAQCAPDPTVTNQTTTCSGADLDGLQVTTSGSSVLVSAGATVSSSSAAAIAVDIPGVANWFVVRNATLAVSGSVSGVGNAGVSLLSGTIPANSFDFYGTRLAVTVASGGAISGTNGIVVGQSAGNGFGPALLTLDNAGTITGGSGAALLSTAPAIAGFESITNRTGGFIGAISGPIGTLSNAGTIDGGLLSAIDQGAVNNGRIFPISLGNSGVIRSNSSTATIVNLSTSYGLTNSGTIQNSGSGAAIGGGTLTITNTAQGLVSSAGVTAINASTYLGLVNSGRIVGNVVVGATQSGSASSIDNSIGSIEGSLTLGAGDDLLVARYTDRLITGVTGSIDGGAGRDTLRILLNNSATIDAPIALPVNFERLSIAPVFNATATLGQNFTAASLAYSGGTTVNYGRIEGGGRVLETEQFGSSASFSNFGNVRSTSAAPSGAAVAISGYGSFANAGTVSAAGDGINFSSEGEFTNSGLIEASGTAMVLFGPRFVNSGTIRSTGGTGAIISGSQYPLTNRSNSGLIEGATIGVSLSTGLTNTGTIRSAGIGVQLESHGQIDNRAGAVISGGAAAIGPAGPFIFNTYVSNAGTINGNVAIGTTFRGFYPNSNIFIAQPGGIVNGNLTLGFGDYLVTELSGSGNGRFAGINGTVTASDSFLRYRVRSDTSAVYAPVSGFQTIGYELFDGAKLTLTTAPGPAAPILLAGKGAVDITADIVGAGVPLIQSTALLSDPGTTGTGNALAITSRGALTLTHSASDPYPAAAVVLGGDSFQNLGTITVREQAATVFSPLAAISGGTTVTNSGTISLGRALGVRGASSLVNSGTIGQLDGTTGSAGVQDVPIVTNSGTIRVDGLAIAVTSFTADPVVITNAQSGVIAGGPTAISVSRGFTLANAGTISASGATPIAIQGSISGVTTITNSGTITGAIQSGFNADAIDNSGLITGDVRLGAGNDSFIQRGAGLVSGMIDGGTGIDRFTVDSTGNGALSGNRIVNFEQLTQIGTGEVAYSGTFTTPSILLNGGALSVAAGQTLTTAAATTVIGGDVGVTVINTGSIAGTVRFGGGNDRYVQGATSSVGSVDGGGGTNLYEVALAGDRTGIAARTNFQQLAVTGTGRLTLTLDQSYQSIALAGTSLTTSLAGRTIGSVIGSEAREQIAVDGDISSISLGGGDDVLALGAVTWSGRYDGGTGNDTLRLTAGVPVTLGGTATGFELVENRTGVTITGTLQNVGRLAFTGGGAVTVADGGMLSGMIDLGGAGAFSLAAGATLAGTVSGGGGSSAATLALAGDRTLSAGTLSNFQRLSTEGTGTLTLAGGAFAFDAFNAANSVVVAADATLAVSRIVFGGGNDRFTIGGRFSGSVDGGAGLDSIETSGGTSANPVSFGSVTNVESVLVSGGFATVSSAAVTGGLAIAGGRLVGLAGSTITASAITVARGATFGSAGTVNGNIAVAGTLSPGASPGTMIVNGNVALASGSTTLFEITPTVSDMLVVNGQLAIASGATLQIAEGSSLRPGAQLDLITATGGISGTFGTILKPAGFFGLVVQDSSRIRLLGQFLNDPAFSPQVSRAINYVNDVLASGNAGAALLAAAPSLLTSTGATNVAQFARVGPEPYAAARQIAIENGLTIVDAARGETFAQRRDAPGMFTFGTALGSRRSLAGTTRGGTSQSTIDSYGLIAGLGWAGSEGSVSLFGGYLNSRQRVTALSARTNADGVVVGAHGSVTAGAFNIAATAAYDGGTARTRRSVLDGTARGKYELRGWTFDTTAEYRLWSSPRWEVRPGIGFTAIRAIRAATNETGSNALSLSVARRSDTALFVDGKVAFARALTFEGLVRPYLSLGARYQIEGRDALATAALGGNALGLIADSARRARLLATATAGAEFVLSSRLSLFASASGQSGVGDHQATGRGGIRFGF